MDSKSLRFINHQSLFAAAQSGDVQALRELLAPPPPSNNGSGGSEPDPNSLLALQNDAGKTALYVAAENNCVEAIRFLVGLCDLQTAKIRCRGDSDAFSVAAARGHLGIIKELTSKWPELCKICNSSNTSPLYLAAAQGHVEVVSAILDADASSAKTVRKNGKTALHNAARYGLMPVVKTLIERDPEIVSVKDKKGQTALHMAVKGHDSSVIEELLDANHSILNERDKKGNTALHIATRKARPQIVNVLLTYTSINVNAFNNQNETAMDLADKLQYGDSSLSIKDSLMDAGAKNARFIGQVDEAMELKRTVSDIKHEVQSQVIQNEKTRRRVSGIAKELKKIHREAVQNTVNSVTLVAVLFASIAFLAIFNLPGQYTDSGEARVAETAAFRIFCLLNATSLFISLSVVVVQITLVAWDTRAQKKVVSVVNKMMWAAGVSTCGAFLAIGFVVVGKKVKWMAITITGLGVPILIGTLIGLCYVILRPHFGGGDSQRRIKRGSGSKSFSLSFSFNFSDLDDYNSDEKIYAL
ncbi:unnamed protein product [Cuscuta campestris]|uniref:PGG domain-containing protein n=1 Tax=Cuscuta campestris TaxID=132261 RepID=A0A484LNZ5_9ASTE|nr:unnamed protein product [Cuscuta campestris]